MSLKYLLIPLVIVAGRSSCNKKGDGSDASGTKPVNDILCSKTWKAEEIRVQFNNQRTTYYKRGASGTLYESDSIKFFSDNTGVYYYDDTPHTITWKFTNNDKTKMKIVIDYQPPVTLFLENIHLTETYFRYAQYSSDGVVSYLASGTRVPN